jgi:hypothetical protein
MVYSLCRAQYGLEHLTPGKIAPTPEIEPLPPPYCSIERISLSLKGTQSLSTSGAKQRRERTPPQELCTVPGAQAAEQVVTSRECRHSLEPLGVFRALPQGLS